jgi:hypothetical protein
MDHGLKYQSGGGGVQGNEEACGSREGGRRTWMAEGPVWGGQVARGMAVVVDENASVERRMGKNMVEGR